MVTATEVVNAVEHYGSQRAAARALGMPRSTLRSRLDRARRAIPTLPERDLSIPEILDAKRTKFRREQAYRDASRWVDVRLPETQPFGVLWFGDPHLDDDGCHVEMLERDIALTRGTDGLYGACVGDYTNNWVGRLIRLHAEQNTSAARARKLASWFLHDSGVPWLLWVTGNHDAFNDGEAYIDLMNGGRTLVQHQSARIELQAAGQSWKVHCAHNFKGHSMWNKAHGMTRAARMDTAAELLVCGHTHDWIIQHEELHSPHRAATLVRTRGYKFHDEYADTLGFPSSHDGAAVLTILNPRATCPSGRVLTFADALTGCEVLKALRSPVKAPKPKRATKKKAPANGTTKKKSARKKAPRTRKTK